MCWMRKEEALAKPLRQSFNDSTLGRNFYVYSRVYYSYTYLNVLYSKKKAPGLINGLGFGDTHRLYRAHGIDFG